MARPFEKVFRTEEDCLRYLANLRWPNGKFSCPACAQSGEIKPQKRGLIQCSSCRRQTSVTAGTIFHGAKTTLLKLFRIFWNIANGTNQSARSIAAELNLSYETCWRWIKKAQVIVSTCLKGSDKARSELHWTHFMPVVFKRSREQSSSEEPQTPEAKDSHDVASNLVPRLTSFISKTFHGVSRKYLQRYADQFSLCNSGCGQLFIKLIRSGIGSGPISLRMIVDYSSPEIIVLI